MIAGLMLLLSVAFIICSAYIDAEHIKDNDFIENHTSRVVQRGIVALLIGVISPLYAAGFLCLYGALFDAILNKFREMPLLYLGVVAKWDLFWKKRIRAYIVIKTLLLLTGILLFIIKWEY